MDLEQSKTGFESAKNELRSLMREIELSIEENNFLAALITADKDLEAMAMNAAMKKLEFDKHSIRMEVYQTMMGEEEEATSETADIQHKGSK